METVDTIEALETLYGDAHPLSLAKVVDRLTPAYRRWVEAARFVVVSTAGPEGTDASPRGDDGPVVRVIDQTTLWLPDWRGNNRLDTLRNIVRDGRVSLLFMANGHDNVVRINGTARLLVDEAATATFARRGLTPKCVIEVRIGEAYFQCAKALMRSRLWTQAKLDLPGAGAFLAEQREEIDAAEYDAGYAEYARTRMW